MAVIGKGVVGKSSLTYRYINYKVPQGHDPTIEDRYKTTSTINGKVYSIEILATAGEDDYQNMMDMWISFGEGFLLVFAINDKVFAGFESPKTLKQSYEIIRNNFKVNGWTTGNRGITFTLKAG